MFRSIERQQFLFLAVFATAFSVILALMPRAERVYVAKVALTARVPNREALLDLLHPTSVYRPRGVDLSPYATAGLFRYGATALTVGPLAAYLESPEFLRQVSGKVGPSASLVVYSVKVQPGSSRIELTAESKFPVAARRFLNEVMGTYLNERVAPIAVLLQMPASELRGYVDIPDRMLGAFAATDRVSGREAATRRQRPALMSEFERELMRPVAFLPHVSSGPTVHGVQTDLSIAWLCVATLLSGLLALSSALIGDRRRQGVRNE